MSILVTGGAGFIGSAVVRRLVSTGNDVVSVDALTYAGNLDSVRDVEGDPRYAFHRADIREAGAIRRIIEQHQPSAIIHLAAESHVDRSIDGPRAFVETNIIGTFELLQEARRYWTGLSRPHRETFRFVHVSTDEVFGSAADGSLFREDTRYNPASPYSASKAASDHLVRAWQQTFGVPTVVTTCSNNYGPCQFPEKLIPLTILNALEGKPVPVYGKGENVRDWLHVEDHADALIRVLERGRAGETYAIGARNERRNIDVVTAICDAIDTLRPDVLPRRRLIQFVEDRPGHDQRYAIDPSRIESELGWGPLETFESGLLKTVKWYLDNEWWWQRVRSGAYRGERLGLAANV